MTKRDNEYDAPGEGGPYGESFGSHAAGSDPAAAARHKEGSADAGKSVPDERGHAGAPPVTLEANGAFSYPETYGYLTRSEQECMFHMDGGMVYKLFMPSGASVPLLLEVGPYGDHGLQVSFPAQTTPLSEAVRREAGDYVAEWFDLRRDLAGFYRLTDADPLLSLVSHRFRGLRMIGIADLFEAMSWGIIGQQINLGFAYTLKRRLVEAYGSRILWAGRSLWTFPSPEMVAGLTVEGLRTLQFSTKKAEYLIETAARLADGRLTKAGLLACPSPEAAERELTQIRGIGPWTAHYVLMRCLRVPTAFPAGDVGLQNAVKHLLGLERKPTPKALRAMAEAWTGWEAYAVFYLWRSLY